MGVTQTRKPQPVYYDVADDDDFYQARMPSSTRRYAAPDTMDDPAVQGGTLIQRRRASRQPQGLASTAIAPSRPEVHTAALPRTHAVRRFPLAILLIGMVGTVLLLMVLGSLSSWWQTYQDDLHYGRPRTSQLDAVVGHSDSAANPTHFIFLNLHGHIEILEMPGGDAAHAHIYTGPTLFGEGQDLIPVTGEIRNDNGHQNLIVHIQNQQIVFVNDGTTFHAQSQ